MIKDDTEYTYTLSSLKSIRNLIRRTEKTWAHYTEKQLKGLINPYRCREAQLLEFLNAYEREQGKGLTK